MRGLSCNGKQTMLLDITNFVKLPSDRLPDLEEVVTVIGKNERVFKACRVEIDNEVSWAEFHSENELSELLGKDEPLAWQPISDE